MNDELVERIESNPKYHELVSKRNRLGIQLGAFVLLMFYTFILVIASFVQFTEMIIKKYSPALYKSLGVFLPLITTNCAVLYVALDNIKQGFDLIETIVYSLAVPIGFTLVLYLFSAIRERLDLSDVPAPFKGNAIAMVVAAIMALAFGGLAGLV